MNKLANQGLGPSDPEVNPFYLSKDYLPIKGSEARRLRAPGARPVLLLIPELFGGRPSPCAYIRLLIPLTSPIVQNRFEIRIGSLKNASAISADVVVVNRIPCERESDLEPFLQHLRATGTKLVYDIDDQLLDLPNDHPEANLYREKQTVVQRLLAEADVVWTSTDALTNALRSRSRTIATIENCLDIFESEFEQPRRRFQRRPSGKFNIVYMGTATHGTDLGLILEPLRRLASVGQRFNLHLIGVSTNPPTESWIRIKQPPMSASTYPRFMQWLRTLNEFDLGIAPLGSSPFNRCKSAIKFWDYTAMGIPTLASDVEAYRGAIQDGHSGYLAANDADAWYDKLRLLMNQTTQLQRVASNATYTLRKRYAELNCRERRTLSILEALGVASS